jgi:UDP-N-acetylmuramoyl-tripeptide--D-alanyl-D-alanine ligase
VHAADQPAAIKLLELEPDDVVLVKGSRYRTWDVVDTLRSGFSASSGGPGAGGRHSPEEVRP